MISLVDTSILQCLGFGGSGRSSWGDDVVVEKKKVEIPLTNPSPPKEERLKI